MFITLLLVVLLLQIFSGAQNSWRSSEQRVDSFREARGAVQVMTRDLGATLQETYLQTAGSSTATTNPLLPTLLLQHAPDIPAESSGPLNEEIYCLTNVPNAGASSLCAVGYYCEWIPDFNSSSDAPHAYALMRRSLDSNGLYQRFQAASGSTTPLMFSNLFSVSGTPTASVTQLAAYIWDLRFRIDTDLNDGTGGAPGGVPDGDAPTAPADHTPGTNSLLPATPPGPYYYNDAKQPYPSRLPAYVEIRFRALSDLAGRRLEGNSSVTPSTWKDSPSSSPSPTPTPSATYVQIIQPSYQQFVVRVPLVNANPLPSPAPSANP